MTTLHSTSLYCSVCHHPNRAGSRFCTACGSELPTENNANTGRRVRRRWLKWGGIGCGGLIALVIIGIVLGAIFGGGAGDEDSGPVVVSATTPSPTSTIIASPTPLALIDPRRIWDDYLSNETRANRTWKGDWLALKMGPIDEIEDDGRVLMYVDGSVWNYIELDFKNDDDVIELNRGDTVIAICKLSGFELDSWLNFKDCKYPE